MIVENEIYYIISRKTHFALDVHWESKENTAAVIIHPLHKNKNQQWFFTRAESNSYFIQANHSHKCLDNGYSTAENFKTHQWDLIKCDWQKWELLEKPGGYFKIKSVFSAKYLTAGKVDESVVQLSEINDDDQLWEIIPEGKLNISLKFLSFPLKISHNHINDIGKFPIFCMRCLRSGLTLEDIATIVCLEKSIIQKQLEFIISREYINADYTLTEKGNKLLDIFNFVKHNNEYQKPILALDLYVNNSADKKIYCVDKNDFTEEALFVEVTPTIKSSLRACIIWEEMNELDSDLVLRLLNEIYPDKSDLIGEIADEIKIIYEELIENNGTKYIYLNRSIELQRISNYISNEANDEIKLLFPAKRISPQIEVLSSFEGEANSIEEQTNNIINQFAHEYNLVTGEEEILTESNSYGKTYTPIQPNFSINELIERTNRSITIPEKLLLKINFNICIEDRVIRKYINNQNLSRLIEEKQNKDQ